MRIVSILVLIVMLGACESGIDGRHGMFSASPIFLSNLPDGDDSYSVGFRFGCNQAIGVIGSGVLRNQEVAYNPNQGIADKDYYKGYKDGEAYCTYYTDDDPL